MKDYIKKHCYIKLMQTHKPFSCKPFSFGIIKLKVQYQLKWENTKKIFHLKMDEMSSKSIVVSVLDEPNPSEQEKTKSVTCLTNSFLGTVLDFSYLVRYAIK